MPRADLFEMRAVQLIHTPVQLVMLYQYDRLWRSIWTDGRALPKDPDPHWYGYSTGKWVDDYTFQIQTVGMDERTWLDNAGRPHSEDLHVIEEFHRIDRDHLELSVTIDDPKYYSTPWVALDRLPFHLMPANYDMQDMICAPSEVNSYNKLHANPGGTKGK